MDFTKLGLPALLMGAQALYDQARQTQNAIQPVDMPAAADREWGIYLNGAKVLEPDSFLALDYYREWAIADYPMERGAFQNYNKVAKPFDIRLRITKGGRPDDRKAYLAAIETLAADLNQYDVVTPDKTYLSANVSSLGYTRAGHNGAGLVTVDLRLQEIRVTATAGFTDVQAPQSAAPVSTGTVQPQPTPAPVQKAVTQAVTQSSESTVFSDTVGPL